MYKIQGFNITFSNVEKLWLWSQKHTTRDIFSRSNMPFWELLHKCEANLICAITLTHFLTPNWKYLPILYKFYILLKTVEQFA